MSFETTLRRNENDENYVYTQFSHSVLAAVARARAAQNTDRISEHVLVEGAVASGTISLEDFSLTTDLL